MPAGCPPKRPSDAMESPPDSSSPASKPKLPRLERGPEDFSQVVKNKLQSYTRTGQACDRCKVRKIRCDALPEGCSHCAQQNLDCYVTDRVTGRTERRGYLQQLEREKNDMLSRLRDMERLLDDKGVQIRPWQWSSAYGSDHETDPSRDQWSQFGSLWIKDVQKQRQKPSSGYSVGHPSPFSGTDARTVDARLGVAADNAPLSSINGTQLSILGTTIDVTSFDAPDMDGPPCGTPNNTPLYNKSIQSFYNSVHKAQPPIEAPMPSREEAFSYSEWYFIMAGPFVPVLHKPTYIKLLTRIYDDPTFKPSTAELAIVHMVFALMYYQFGVRNGEGPERKAQLNDVSNKHYHWCLDKTNDLISDLSIPSVQALILIATHCRGFPKPGPAYHMASIAWARAMEMNLHRAYLKQGEPTNLENEMRKRLWWCILMLVVTLYGRIGMPMPIRAEDFDVELPVCVPDECITENGIIESDRNRDCAWLVGLAGFKLTCLYMELWNDIYSVRQDPKKYAASVRRLEEQFRNYEDELSDDIRPGKCRPQNQVNAYYLDACNSEFLLCLRHPSRCIASDPSFIADNNRISEDSARKLLKTANELARLKSLDTTWYQMAVYVAAVFTILAAHWERRFDVTPADFANLQSDMNMGLFVISEVSKYIGVGPDSRIMPQISSVIDRTMASIEQGMGTRRNSNTTTVQSQLQSHTLTSGPIKHEAYGSAMQRQPRRSASSTPTSLTNGTDPVSVHRTASMGNTSYYNGPMTTPNAAYPHMGYTDIGQPAGPTPTTGTNNIQPSYLPVNEETPSQYIYAASAAATAAAAQMNHHNTPGNSTPQPVAPTHNPMLAYSPQSAAGSHPLPHPHHAGGGDWMTPSGHGMNTVQTQHQVPNGANTWHEWTNAIAMMDPSSQDRYSANALLTLNAGQRDAGVAVPGVHDPTAQWPMVIYNPNVSGS